MQESVRQSLQFIGLSSMPPQSVVVAALTVKGVRAKRGSGGADELASVGEAGGDELSSTLKAEPEEGFVEDEDDETESGGRNALAAASSSSASLKTGGSAKAHKRVKSEPIAFADVSADGTGEAPSAKRARREEASSDTQQQALERKVEIIARGLKRGLTRTRNRF